MTLDMLVEIDAHDIEDNDDDDVEEYLQALFVWSPSLGSTKYSTLFFFNNFCRSTGSLSLKSAGWSVVLLVKGGISEDLNDSLLV